MDFIAYLIVFAGIGLSKIYMSKAEPVNTIISKPAESIEIVSIQVGNNYELYREPDAYTLILEEFGLK